LSLLLSLLLYKYGPKKRDHVKYSYSGESTVPRWLGAKY